MNIELLGEADRVLSACGRPIIERGSGYVDIPKGLQYQKYLAANSADTTEEKVIDTPAPFVLKAIQAYAQPATLGNVFWQLRFPNGRYFQSRVCAVSESFNSGSYRLAINPPLECQPGQRFWITTDGLLGNAGADAAITVLLEGVLRWSVKGPQCGLPPEFGEPWASMPRYTRNPNQNICAPEWRLGGQTYPETPTGYRDEPFKYCTPLNNLIPVPTDGSILSDQIFRITEDCDFVARQIAFPQITGPGGLGTLYVRVRKDDGTEITDGFTNAARMTGLLFPELPLKAGSALLVDFQLVQP